MATMQKKVELAVSAAELWGQVRYGCGLSQLRNVVAESKADGDQRSCVLADGGRSTFCRTTDPKPAGQLGGAFRRPDGRRSGPAGRGIRYLSPERLCYASV